MSSAMLNVIEELSDTSRRLILSELRSGAKNVSEICEGTHLKQPNVSNHLARMRTKGIVQSQKVGRQVFYLLATPEIEAIVNSIFVPSDASRADLDFPEMAKSYAKAAIEGDEAACSEIMDTAFRARTPLIDVYQDLLGPAMAMIGTWWSVDAIHEAQEHMATEITHRMMARTAQIAGPMRRNGKIAVLGCAANNYHVIGLRMISDYLRMSGWKTLFLGPNVPVKSFVTTVQNYHPDLVLLSVNAAEGGPDTLKTVQALAEAKSKKLSFRVGVGGQHANQAPDAFLAAGADFLASDLRHFAAEVLPSFSS
jgi:methanogenic corrinoid protein MtbC1